MDKQSPSRWALRNKIPSIPNTNASVNSSSKPVFHAVFGESKSFNKSKLRPNKFIQFLSPELTDATAQKSPKHPTETDCNSSDKNRLKKSIKKKQEKNIHTKNLLLNDKTSLNQHLSPEPLSEKKQLIFLPTPDPLNRRSRRRGSFDAVVNRSTHKHDELSQQEPVKTDYTINCTNLDNKQTYNSQINKSETGFRANPHNDWKSLLVEINETVARNHKILNISKDTQNEPIYSSAPAVQDRVQKQKKCSEYNLINDNGNYTHADDNSSSAFSKSQSVPVSHANLVKNDDWPSISSVVRSETRRLRRQCEESQLHLLRTQSALDRYRCRCVLTEKAYEQVLNLFVRVLKRAGYGSQQILGLVHQLTFVTFGAKDLNTKSSFASNQKGEASVKSECGCEAKKGRLNLEKNKFPDPLGVEELVNRLSGHQACYFLDSEDDESSSCCWIKYDKHASASKDLLSSDVETDSEVSDHSSDSEETSNDISNKASAHNISVKNEGSSSKKSNEDSNRNSNSNVYNENKESTESKQYLLFNQQQQQQKKKYSLPPSQRRFFRKMYREAVTQERSNQNGRSHEEDSLLTVSLRSLEEFRNSVANEQNIVLNSRGNNGSEERVHSKEKEEEEANVKRRISTESESMSDVSIPCIRNKSERPRCVPLLGLSNVGNGVWFSGEATLGETYFSYTP